MIPNTMVPLSSKGLFFNALAIFPELSDPFTFKPKNYIDSFSKIDPYYWAANEYIRLKDVDKLSQSEIEEYKSDEKESFHFITEVFFIPHLLIKLPFKKVIKVYNKKTELLQGLASAKDMAGIKRNLPKLFSMQVHMFSK